MKRLAIVVFPLLLLGCGETGNAPDLATSRGHWVVINYWAQWCKPCIKEIPELNQLARQHPEIHVLGVNYDGATGEELSQQVRALGIEFPLLEQDPSAALGISRPAVLPTTLIISPEGELRESLVGPQTLDTILAATRRTEIGQ